MNEFRSEVMLSVARALLGEVFPELVAVAGKIEGERKFELIFFVDSVLSDAQADDISCIETEVMADFPNDCEISHRVVVSLQPGLPASDAFWIFHRKLSKVPGGAMKIDATIAVRFRTTAEGGRASDIVAWQLPYYGCPMVAGDRAFDCRFPIKEALALGHTYALDVAFLDPEGALEHLEVGTPIQLWEGKIIADGEITSIFKESL